MPFQNNTTRRISQQISTVSCFAALIRGLLELIVNWVTCFNHPSPTSSSPLPRLSCCAWPRTRRTQTLAPLHLGDMPYESPRFLVHDPVCVPRTSDFYRMRPLAYPLPPLQPMFPPAHNPTTLHAIYVSDATRRIIRAVHSLVTDGVFELSDIRHQHHHFVSPMQDATGVIASSIALVHRLTYPDWYDTVDADEGSNKVFDTAEEQLSSFLHSIGYRVQLAACLLVVYKYRVETEPLLSKVRLTHGNEVNLLPALSVLSRFLDEHHFPCTWERGNLSRHPLELLLLQAEARLLAIDCLHRTIVFNPLAIVQDSFFADVAIYEYDVAHVLQRVLQPFNPADMSSVLSIAAFYQIASALDATSGLYTNPGPAHLVTGTDAMYGASLLFIARTSVRGVPKLTYRLTALEVTLVPTIERMLNSALSVATNLVLRNSKCIFAPGTIVGSFVDTEFINALLRWLRAATFAQPIPVGLGRFAEECVALAARAPISTSSR